MDKSGNSEALPQYQPDTPPAWQHVEEDRPRPRRRLGILHVAGLLVLLTTFFSLSLRAPLRTFALLGSEDDDAATQEVDFCMDQLQYSIQRTEAITFGASQGLSIREKIDTNRSHDGDDDRHRDHGSGHLTHVFGSVILIPDDGSQPAGGRIVLDIASNVEVPDVEVRFDPDTQSFTVLTDPWGGSGGGGGRVCIQMRIAAYVPKQSALDNLLVEADHLDIKISSGLDVHVAQRAAFAALAGGVVAGAKDSYALDARDVLAHTVDGDVRGWFALDEALTLKTVSGDVDVDVSPVADGGPGRTAALDVSSVSGRLSVREALDETLPLDRRYVARVASTSGAIAARLAFADATLESQSGDIDAELLPVPVPASEDDDQRSLQGEGGVPQLRLSTSSKSGRSRVRVLEPRTTDADAGRTRAALSLSSRHDSLSGRIEAAYPSAWEGGFAMKSLSGRLAVRGEGVRWTGGGRFLPRVTGSKGSGPSRLTMESISGSQDLTIGR